MKILARPIEMITVTKENGAIKPIKFKLKNEEGYNTIIKVDQIIFCDEEKLAGNVMYLYRCRSLVDNIDRVYEIKYELSTCKWILWKM